MKIIVVSCVFPPEPVVSARTSFDVANFLIKKGNHVQVVCPHPSRNNSEQDARDENFPFSIKRVFSIKSNKSTFFSRFLENISFGLSTFMFIIRQKGIDVIYANTWPIFATGLLVIASKIKKYKVVISIQDLYPESLVTQRRVSSNSPIITMFIFFDKWIAKNCDHIIVLSEWFESVYVKSRLVKKSKISVIKNWVKSEDILQIEKLFARSDIERHIGHSFDKDDTICIYGGNIGTASGLDEFIQFIPKINTRVKFIFAGDGSLVPELKCLLSEQKMNDRVFFITPWPSEMTSSVLSSADILLLPTAKGQEFSSVPSKLITYMLASKPIMLIADCESEIAKELKKAECGLVISTRSSKMVANGFSEFLQKSDKMKEKMGLCGRQYAKNNYSYELSVNKIYSLLK
jgi:colanic acid biosynthesis glycosyl transferase WcaI